MLATYLINNLCPPKCKTSVHSKPAAQTFICNHTHVGASTKLSQNQGSSSPQRLVFDRTAAGSTCLNKTPKAWQWSLFACVVPPKRLLAMLRVLHASISHVILAVPLVRDSRLATWLSQGPGALGFNPQTRKGQSAETPQ